MGGGIFGSLFDFNGDGKLDALERGMEFMAFQQIMGGGSDDEMDALEAAGLSYEELLLMDEDERRGREGVPLWHNKDKFLGIFGQHKRRVKWVPGALP